MSRKKLIRVVLLLIIFCIAYYVVVDTLRSTFSLSVGEAIESTLRIISGSVVLIVSLSLLSIDLRDVHYGTVELISVGMLLILVSSVYFFTEFSPSGFFRLLSIIIFHFGVHIFLRQKVKYLATRLETSTWGIAQHGIIIFGLFVATTLSFFLGIELSRAPLQCTALYQQLENVATSSIDSVQQGSQNVLQRSQRSVGDVVDEYTQTAATTTAGTSSGFFSKVMQSELVTQIQNDQELVRQSFCDMLVSLVKERIGSGVGMLAVLIILIVLLSPLMTLLFRLVQITVWLLLLLLQLFGVYSRKKRMKRVKILQ